MVAAVEDCGFDGALLSAADDAPAAGAAARPDAVAVAVAAPRPAAAARVALEIDGMHCAACTSACERALKSVPGVEGASVGLLPPRADVVYDADVTGPRALVAALDAAGFAARLADRARPSTDGARRRRAATLCGALCLSLR